MRRSDREIENKKEIFDVLQRCNTIRIAIQGDTFPYVIPVSFGMEILNEKVVIYFHCAQQGLKLDLLNKNPRVCVEGDIFNKVEKTEHGITTRYESVIGFGECQFVSDFEEIVHGLRLITEHYGYFNYPIGRCAGINHLLVGRITLEEVTGKRNLPGMMTPADRMAKNKV